MTAHGTDAISTIADLDEARDDNAPVTLTLLVSSDGDQWRTLVLGGESEGYVDRIAQMTVHELAGHVGLGFAEETDWSSFPLCFREMQRLAEAEARRDQEAIENLVRVPVHA